MSTQKTQETTPTAGTAKDIADKAMKLDAALQTENKTAGQQLAASAANLQAQQSPAPERTFNVYKSSMQAHKVIRPDGKVCHITNGQYITDDPKDIEFIDAEIAGGFPYLRLDKQATATELDPIASLKERMKKEVMEDLIKSGAVAHPAADGASGSPVSTAQLAAMVGNSNSAVK